jgi:hypothetical protein
VASNADFLAIAIVRNIIFPSSLKQTTTIANEGVSSVSTPSRNRQPLVPKTDGIQQRSPAQSVNKTAFRNRIIATPAKIDDDVDIVPETGGSHALSKGEEHHAVDDGEEGMYLAFKSDVRLVWFSNHKSISFVCLFLSNCTPVVRYPFYFICFVWS